MAGASNIYLVKRYEETFAAYTVKHELLRDYRAGMFPLNTVVIRFRDGDGEPGNVVFWEELDR